MKTILIDFDGVIHSYISGWKGIDVVFDPPIENSFDFLNKCLNHFEVYIFSTRCESQDGIFAIIEWFKEYGFEKVNQLKFTFLKIPSWLIIDDRAFRFKGTFPEIEEIENFKPYHITNYRTYKNEIINSD